MVKIILASCLVLSVVNVLNCVDRGNFKTCDQSSFCKRNRALQEGNSPFEIIPGTIKYEYGTVSCDLLNIQTQVSFKLTIDTLEKDTARVRVTELSPIRPRYFVHDSLVKTPAQKRLKKETSEDGTFKVSFGNNVIVGTYKPLRIDFYDSEVLILSFNSRGLVNFEHYRNKQEAPEPVAEETGEEKKEETPKETVKDEEGMWEENFKEHHDSKPNGPSSVGMDVSFLGFEHVYGIPEHADSFALKETTGGDPYRLYNLDVFEYELDNPMALYGSIPFMVAHSARRSVGLFWNNAAETWIDIKSSKSVLSSLISLFKTADVPQVDTHWMSESGIMDVFVLMGPKPSDVLTQYATLTGTATMPPVFGISYHQCRWNYNDQEDVKQVDAGFDEHDIPCDVIWLDIEHTDSKKYMTWDSSKFPNPTEMIDNVASKGRKMVTIIDPHIKRDSGYHIHTQATERQFYVKKKEASDYEGWCWPGSSSWIDFFNPEAQKWWASNLQVGNYQGSTLNLFTWNDMNEPSVFNGPEVTMHKDAIHYGNWEHRDVHNLYGMLQHKSSFNGQLQRSDNKERPFILSRAFFAGTQRYGAVWTGDNKAEWSHLKASIPMLLSMNIAGLPFVGADVGGFFGNPDVELLVRWYQAAAFTPFYRGHAHLETKRREPWLFGPENTKLIRSAIRRRYLLLPYFYNLMRETHETGLPVMRPLWFEYPDDTKTFAMDDQFLLGDSLLVKPVTSSGTTDVLVYFPGGESQVWYDFDTYKKHAGGITDSIPTPMDKIPSFIRGGRMLPIKQRVRRASSLMANDPYTLIFALDNNSAASGSLYVDDGHSNDYKHGKYLAIDFRMTATQINKVDKHANYDSKSWIEKIIVLGMKTKPSSATLIYTDNVQQLSFTYENEVLVIKKPVSTIVGNFVITFS